MAKMRRNKENKWDDGRRIKKREKRKHDENEGK